MVITRIILHLDWKEFTRVRSDTSGTCGAAEYVEAGAGATGAAPMCVKAATPSAACAEDSPVEDVHTNDRQPPRLSVESSVSARTPKSTCEITAQELEWIQSRDAPQQGRPQYRCSTRTSPPVVVPFESLGGMATLI